jgi:hypothetical protein
MVAGALAEAGLNVAGIEAQLVGGVSPHWTYIPEQDNDPPCQPARRGLPNLGHGPARQCCSTAAW